MRRKIRLNENDIRRIVNKSVRRVIKESFDDDWNDMIDKRSSQGLLNGFEMKNPEGEWEYGDITYDPNTGTMSCMGVEIEVDPDMTIDQNLETLYDELMNAGYNDGDYDEDDADY